MTNAEYVSVLQGIPKPNGVQAPPLDVLLASGTITNPLQGNGVLAPLNQLAVIQDRMTTNQNGVVQLGGVALNEATYATSESLVVTPKTQGTIGSSLLPDHIGALPAISADVTGSLFDQIVTVAGCSGNPAGTVQVVATPLDLTGNILSAQSRFGPCETRTPATPTQGVYPAPGSMALAAGHLYETNGAKQVALAYVNGNNVCVRLYDGTTNPITGKGSNCSAQAYPSAYVLPGGGSSSAQFLGMGFAAGDFNGDGVDELALAVIGDLYQIQVNIFSSDANGNLTLTSSNQIGTNILNVYQMGLAVGDLNDDGVDELILGYSDVHQEVASFLKVLTIQVSKNLQTLTTSQSWSVALTDGPAAQANNAATGVALFKIQVGRFGIQAASGPDQVAVVYSQLTNRAYYASQFQTASVNATFFTVDSQLNLQAAASTTLVTANPNPDLSSSITPVPAISAGSGPLSFGRTQLVVGVAITDASSQPWNTTAIYVVQGSTDLTQAPTVTSRTLMQDGCATSATPFTSCVPVVLTGDFSGMGVRVGAPSVFPGQQVGQLLSVIDEPPTHIDVFPNVGATNAVTINVNFPTDINNVTTLSTFSKYAQSNGQSSTQSTQFKKSHQFSIGVSTKIGVEEFFEAEASVKRTTNESKQNDASEYAAQFYGKDFLVYDDTGLIYTEALYDIWEYPVYSQGNTVPDGYLSLIWPVKAPINNQQCLVACIVSGGIPAQKSAKDVGWFANDHEPGNLLSWSAAGSPLSPVYATDVLTGIFFAGALGVDSSSQQIWSMGWSSISKTATTNAWEVGLDWSASATASASWGPISVGSVTVSTSGNYTKNGTKSQEVSFNDSTGLQWSASATSGQDQAYTVEPYVYWSSLYPTMRGNWVVLPSNSSLPNFWSTSYVGNPDFALILPYRDRYGALSPDDQIKANQTTDIRFAWPGMTTGTAYNSTLPVTMTAVVRNYSLTGYTGGTPITVRFFAGDPRSGGTLLGSATAPGIDPQGIAAVTAPSLSLAALPKASCYPIWAQIDSTVTTEIHTDNNLGFTLLGATPTGGDPLGDNPCPGFSSSVSGPTRVQTLSGSNVGALTLGQRPDLTIGPGDIVVTDVGPNRKRATATVHAGNGHFTSVYVSFYDGDPDNGGKLIGTRGIPVVHAGRIATTSIEWDTKGLRGSHNVYVRISSGPGIEATAKNNVAASPLLSFPPYTFFVPTITKNSGFLDLVGAIVPGLPTVISRRRTANR